MQKPSRSAVTSASTDPGSFAADRGLARAQEFDRELRRRVAIARRRRLEELSALDPRQGDDDLTAAWEEEDVPRLEEELLEVTAQLDAVRRSRVWRTAQGLRGLVGRRW